MNGRDCIYMNDIEVMNMILSPSDRYLQTTRKAPSRKPVDFLWGKL